MKPSSTVVAAGLTLWMTASCGGSTSAPSPDGASVPATDVAVDQASSMVDTATSPDALSPPDGPGSPGDGPLTVADAAAPLPDAAGAGPDVTIGGLPRRILWQKEPSGPNFARGMGGTSATDVWIGGSTGDVWHSTGNGQWSRRDIVTAGDVRGFWGSAPNNVYVAAYINRIWRWNGSTWDQFDFQGGVVFTSVWGSSATDVYAVGSGIFRSAGDGMWRLEPVNQFDPMESVWGSGRADVWVALDLGRMLHSRGDGKWTTQAGGTTQSPNIEMWGTGPTDIYLLRGGELVHSTGNGSWVPQPIERGPTEGLRCICGSGPNDVYVGTGTGRVFRSTGDGRWHPERFLPMDDRVLTVEHCWAAPNGEVFTVTGDGTYHGRPVP
jgi:hypothetical protein